MLSNIEDYFLTVMDDYPDNSAFRKSIYLLEGILVCSVTYLWLEYAQMGALYHWLYPIIFSSALVLGHYVVTELFFQQWESSETTIRKFWVISFVGISLSFSIVHVLGVCGVLCRITGSYCPETWHTSAPNILAVFFKIVMMPWAISTFLLTQGVLKKQIVKELSTIKQINESLKQKNIETESKEDSIQGEVIPLKTEDEKRAESFEIQSREGSRKIAFSDIYFIFVEDHYCNFVINRKGEVYQEYVRLSLKEALMHLPPSHFAQVHRSYAVNLQHVRHIKKEGQAYQLLIEGSDDFLPASRHRAHALLPKLKEILN
jgi:hypothetical protein